MKQLAIYANSGNPNKFNYDDKAHMAESIVETAEALAGVWGRKNYMLTNTVITSAGGHITCAAGAMVYNGEPCLFDAQDLTIDGAKAQVWVLVTTHRASDPQTFADSVSRSPHVINKVQMQNVAFADLPVDFLGVGGEVYKDGVWKSLAPLLYSGWVILSGHTAQYRIHLDGKIELRGWLDGTSATADLALSNLASVISGDWGHSISWTADVAAFAIAVGTSIAPSATEWLSVSVAGEISMDYDSGKPVKSLSGVYFYAV